MCFYLAPCAASLEPLPDQVPVTCPQWNGTTPGPQIVGHITFAGPVTGTAADFRSIEVTPFVSASSSGVCTFMIVRAARPTHSARCFQCFIV